MTSGAGLHEGHAAVALARKTTQQNMQLQHQAQGGQAATAADPESLAMAMHVLQLAWVEQNSVARPGPCRHETSETLLCASCMPFNFQPSRRLCATHVPRTVPPALPVHVAVVVL